MPIRRSRKFKSHTQSGSFIKIPDGIKLITDLGGMFGDFKSLLNDQDLAKALDDSITADGSDVEEVDSEDHYDDYFEVGTIVKFCGLKTNVKIHP